MSVLLTGGIQGVVPNPSSHTPGDIITWDDKEWLVCHYDSSKNQVYLIASDTVDNTIFGANYEYVHYLAHNAMDYQTNQMSAEALARCVDVTVPGLGSDYDVTAKVFVPSRKQMHAENYPDIGFSWFNSNEHRKVAGAAGYSTSYWTSSPETGSSKVWYVKSDGSIYYTNTTSKLGFRPCVCVQM